MTTTTVPSSSSLSLLSALQKETAAILPQVGNPSITTQINDFTDVTTNMGRTIMDQREMENRYRILEQQTLVNKEGQRLIGALRTLSSSSSSFIPSTTTVPTVTNKSVTTVTMDTA